MLRRIWTDPQIRAFLVAFVFGGGVAYAGTDWDVVFSAAGGAFVSLALAKPRKATMIIPAGMICGVASCLVASSGQTTLTVTRLLIAIAISIAAAFLGPRLGLLDTASDPSEPGIPDGDR